MRTRKQNTIKFFAVVLLLVAFTPVVSVNAYDLSDETICFGYSEFSLEPKGDSDVFLTTSEKVGFWIRIENPPTDPDIKVKWLDPDDDKYIEHSVDVVEEEDENWGIIYDEIKIHGTSSGMPWNKPGSWTVEMSIDGDTESILQFQILDYQALVQNFLTLQSHIDEVGEQKDALQSQLEEIQLDYAALEEDYNDLQEQSGTDGGFEELQDQYDDLEGSYTSLEVKLATTRMMMYGALVIAVLSVAVAVYFGAIKK